MNCGKVLYAVQEGTWVLRLHGDVRAPWCGPVDELVEKLVSDPALRCVVVDARETTNIDSTMLGMIARIAVQVREKRNVLTQVVAPNADIRRLLESMCLDKVLTIVNEAGEALCECAELAEKESLEPQATQQVVNAHRVLMAIDESNQARFSDVVATLENQQRVVSR